MVVKNEDNAEYISHSKMTHIIDFTKIFSLMSSMLKPFYRYLTILTLTAMSQSVLIGFKELSVKFIIDKLVSFDGLSVALIWVGFLMLGDLAIELSYRITDRVNYKYRPKLKKHIAQTLLKKMLNYSYDFYQDKNPTELSSCVTNVFDGVEDSIIIIFDEFIHFALLLLSTSLYALLVSAQISLILMSWGVLWLCAALYWGSKMYMLTYAFSRAQIRLEGNMSDMFGHMFTVHSFHNVQKEMNNVSEWTDDVVNAEMILRRMQFKVWIIQGFSFCVINGLILTYVVYLYSKGLVTAGDISFIFGLVANLYISLWDLAKEVREFIDAAGKIAQGLYLINGVEVNENIESISELKVTKGDIIFENIEFEYPRRHYVYKEDDKGMLFRGTDYIHIKAGEIVGLVGPSGSGKSTLLKLLLRIFNVNDGKILIDNQDISKVTLSSLRKNIAMIPQDAGLFMQRSIAENIGYGTFDEIDDHALECIIEAAKQTQAHEFIMQLPEHYHTVMSDHGIDLSGGQKQRIALARGFVRKASIFLLDEATAALDNLTQSSIQEHLYKTIRGKTTLIIAHRLNTLKNTDRVLVFDKGRLLQDGKHDDLILQEGLYKQLWECQ